MHNFFFKTKWLINKKKQDASEILAKPQKIFPFSIFDEVSSKHFKNTLKVPVIL